jgi:hypothetical protein
MIDVLLNATPRRADKDRVYGVVGVGQDITERKRAETELQQAAVNLKRLNSDLEEKNSALNTPTRTAHAQAHARRNKHTSTGKQAHKQARAE